MGKLSNSAITRFAMLQHITKLWQGYI